MKKFLFLTLLLPLFLIPTGCEKLFIKPDVENTPQACFESMWSRIDEKYSFLSYKHINWDSVKAVYQPQIHDNMSEGQLFSVLDSMLYTLRDGHVNLIAPFNISRNWEWYLGFPQNYNASVVERYYLGNNYYITGPFTNQLFSYGGKKIGYFHYSSFSNNFSDYDLSFIVNRFQNADGLIIDLRDNGGGITTNVFKMLNRFVKNKTLVGRCFEKSGKGHNDFKMAYEMYAEPSTDSKGNTLPQFLDKPVVILTNRSCYSATNMFVGFMSTLPNVKIVGDRTGGGGGLPTSYQLPNGWVYRFSSTMTILPNGYNIEGGIPTSIHQDMSPTNEANGIDDILNKALQQF